MKPKYLILSSIWESEYLYRVVSGIKRRFGNMDYVMDILNAYDIIGHEISVLKEQEIYALYNPSDYKGVFVVWNTVGNRRKIIEMLEKTALYRVPIVNIGSRLPGTVYIGTDYYNAMYRIVEHMIIEHDCHVLNYVGGPVEASSSAQRYRAFCDCLNNHGIEIDYNRVLELNYDYTDGIYAYEEFKKKGIALPDCVICANDNMALGYCTAAGDDGYFAPTDFKITGIDNYYLASEHNPSITSMEVDKEEMGYVAAEILIRILDGENVDEVTNLVPKMHLGQSCGCIDCFKDVRKEAHIKLHNSKKTINTSIAFRYILENLCMAPDFSNISNAISNIRERVYVPKFAICLNASVVKALGVKRNVEYDEDIICYTADGVEEFKRSEQMIPTSWKKDRNTNFVLYSSLYFEDLTFGYLAVEYNENSVPFFDGDRDFTENISVALETIRKRIELNYLNGKLEYAYTHDSLTNLHNRFGYAEYVPDFCMKFAGKVCVIAMDLNFLKKINDGYGHHFGDLAIKGAAEAIDNAFTDSAIKFRMGGDEFLVIDEFVDDEKILQSIDNVRKYLVDYSERNSMPIELSAGIGYAYDENAFKDFDFYGYFKLEAEAYKIQKKNILAVVDRLNTIADEAMYLDKSKHHVMKLNDKYDKANK